MISNPTLQAMLSAHACADKDEKFAVDMATSFLLCSENALCRDNPAGHFTASAWIVDASMQKVLLHHHKKFDRWLQLGGHIEGGETVVEAALREAREESGISALSLLGDGIFDVDVHRVSDADGLLDHFHYDIRFLVMAEHTRFEVSNESHALAWLTLEEARLLTDDASMLRMIDKTVGLLESATAAP